MRLHHPVSAGHWTRCKHQAQTRSCRRLTSILGNYREIETASDRLQHPPPGRMAPKALLLRTSESDRCGHDM